MAAKKQIWGAREAERQGEERFRVLAESLPSIVWTADPDGTITYANAQWFRFCGLTPEQNARGWVDRFERQLDASGNDGAMLVWLKPRDEEEPG